MRRISLLVLFLFAAACGSVEPESAEFTAPDVGVEEDSTPEEEATTNEETVEEEEEAQPEEALEPATVFERGPYNIGHRRFEISYDAVGETNRTIQLSVWYPTLEDEGEPGLYLINYQRHEVIRDAEPAIDEKAPILVFSHGNSSMGEQSFFMTEFWATHGWVVVAPYHTGNTIYDDLGGISFESASFRPQDITATLDAMYGLDASDPLAGKLSDDVVMSGHSFGGFTTLAISGAEFAVDEVEEACSGTSVPRECSFIENADSLDLFRAGFLDERVDVAIPQTPGGFNVFLDGLSAIEIPTLVMTGALDATLPATTEGNRIWAAMTGPHMRMDLRAGGHFTFSNMCDLAPGFVENDGCGDDFIEKERAYEIINAYSLAWARRVLWGDSSNDALLSGDDDRYVSDVKLSWKPGSDLQ